jgi:hypothetical protein
VSQKVSETALPSVSRDVLSFLDMTTSLHSLNGIPNNTLQNLSFITAAPWNTSQMLAIKKWAISRGFNDDSNNCGFLSP